MSNTIATKKQVIINEHVNYFVRLVKLMNAAKNQELEEGTHLVFDDLNAMQEVREKARYGYEVLSKCDHKNNVYSLYLVSKK